MNGPLREAAVTDPEWARKEWRREFWIKAVTAGVLIALAIGVLTIFQNRSQDSKITRVEHSACQEDARSRECQQTKLEAEEAANLHVTCIPFRKAGYPCPRRGSKVAKLRQGRVRAAPPGHGPVPTTAKGGTAAPHAPAIGPDKPSKSTPNPSEPRHEPSPEPASGGNDGPSAPSSSPETTTSPAITQPTQASEPPAAAPPVIETPRVPPSLPTPAAPALVPKALEDVKEAVKDVGETVDQAQCGVRGVMVGPCP